MNLLFINKFFWRKGGSESVYFDEMSLLKSRGHRILPFSMQDPRNLPTEYSRYFVSHIDYERAGAIQKLRAAGRIIYSLEARRRMARLLREQAIDIAHFHIFQHQISPSVFGPLRQAGIPLVLTLHDLKPLCPNYLMYTQGRVCEACKGRRFYNCVRYRCTKGSRAASLVNMVEMYLHHALGYYRQVDRYIAVSRFYRDKMIEYGFPESQITYIPNFVDTQRFAFSGKDAGYGIYIGRLSAEKGLKTLLDACEKVPEIPMKIVGTGPMEQELKAEAERRRLAQITFCGYKTGKELTELLSAASFSVLPSEWYENCPMSALESLSTGTPVIGAESGGIPELIAHGKDGFHFPPGDAEALADRMRRLWTSQEKRVAMGRAGSEKIRADFTAERHYEQLQALYASLAPEHRQQGT